MKKIIILCVCLVLIMATFISCGFDDIDLYRLGYGIPMDWPRVELEEYGSICMPEEWEVTTVDGFIYIYSNEAGERRNIFIESGYYISENNYFSDIESSERLISEVFSNGCMLYKNKFNYKDGSSREMFYLELQLDKVVEKIYLYCVDDSITKEMLKKIGKSHYSPSHHKYMTDLYNEGKVPNV